LWPAGLARPAVSTINSIDGGVKAVAAIVCAGTRTGAFSAFSTETTHMILDVNGYFRLASNPQTMQFYPLPPCRLMNTRDRSGIAGGGAFKSGETRTFYIRGACGVPASARAYSLNFTAVSNGALGYLTTWPANLIRPVVSTLNSPRGGVLANAAIVPGDASGAINIYATDATDIVVDIKGYFAPKWDRKLILLQFASLPFR
jgi:hypothetical protein